MRAVALAKSGATERLQWVESGRYANVRDGWKADVASIHI